MRTYIFGNSFRSHTHVNEWRDNVSVGGNMLYYVQWAGYVVVVVVGQQLAFEKRILRSELMIAGGNRRVKTK